MPHEQKPTFEKALERLEKLVELLDDGNIPLADALAFFKEGNALAATCRALLDDAERQVTEAFEGTRPQAGSSTETELNINQENPESSQYFETSEDRLPL
ncbi:MAG: exodeoxyribonuclease VII small subunit [Candidatus Eremiobacteraeota bacterium]|nr:exodeoxyribonuclease VII small subunit [Candidatus Eremiobacteraeota bacterium]MBC5827213.1 exodeoxyribonuclease VII small subunit [Candidatus Eremiobacteraeota bacterium]